GAGHGLARPGSRAPRVGRSGHGGRGRRGRLRHPTLTPGKKCLPPGSAEGYRRPAMENRERLERVLQSSSDRANNPGTRAMGELIRRVETIAVVGMSRDPMKPARRIPSYLAAMGAQIIPINPNAGRMLGKPVR